MMGEDIARCTSALEDAGADMIGGCCVTTPEFIREVAVALSGY